MIMFIEQEQTERMEFHVSLDVGASECGLGADPKAIRSERT
jgi:hypothetical protein